MNYPEIRNALDEFLPRMVIKIDKLGRNEKDYSEVLNICRENLKKKYEIVVSENDYTIKIGKEIKP